MPRNRNAFASNLKQSPSLFGNDCKLIERKGYCKNNITSKIGVPWIQQESPSSSMSRPPSKDPLVRAQARPNLPKFPNSRPFVVAVWICHFLGSLLVIVWSGAQFDKDHKYIPIDPRALSQDSQCSKAYADVLALGFDDEDTAIVCCTPESNEGICYNTPWYLPFARRLAKIPDAWLLPLFPWMIRIVIESWNAQRRPKTADNDKAFQGRKKFTIRRLCLYFGLIQVRGWILYLLFDRIENQIVAQASDSCWYDGLLRTHQSPCQGSSTDFSDHMVLYFGQILPIPLTEVLFSFVAPPFWEGKRRVPLLLVGGLFYLYLLCFLGTYKTVAFFHTNFEIFVGYMISLLIQVPLFLILGTSFLEPLKHYFFGMRI